MAVWKSEHNGFAQFIFDRVNPPIRIFNVDLFNITHIYCCISTNRVFNVE